MLTDEKVYLEMARKEDAENPVLPPTGEFREGSSVMFTNSGEPAEEWLDSGDESSDIGVNDLVLASL